MRGEEIEVKQLIFFWHICSNPFASDLVNLGHSALNYFTYSRSFNAAFIFPDLSQILLIFYNYILVSVDRSLS